MKHRFTAWLLTCGLLGGLAQAQTPTPALSYPDKPVTLILQFAAGVSAD